MSARRGGVSAELDEASLKELRSALERAADAALAGVAAGVALTAEAAVALERSLAPVDTGALRDGIRARYSDGGTSARIGVFDPDLYYALFVEFGTSVRPPVPFATPAAERARVELPRNVTAQVRAKVRGT